LCSVGNIQAAEFQSAERRESDKKEESFELYSRQFFIADQIEMLQFDMHERTTSGCMIVVPMYWIPICAICDAGLEIRCRVKNVDQLVRTKVIAKEKG
jgi:hypothetical protein